MLTCLDTIIGLSQTECSCFPTDGLEIDTDTSDSGLFLDELEGLNLKMIDAGSGCGDDSVWAMMNLARKQAIHELTTKLLVNLAMRYKLAREPYKSTIGSANYSKSLTVAAQIMDFKLHTFNLPGASIKLKRIAVLGSGVSLTIPLTIYKEAYINGSYGDPVVLGTLDLPMNPPTVGYVNVTDEAYQILPCDGSRYSFMYNYDGTYLLRDNPINCGCGKKETYLWRYIQQAGSSSKPQSLSLDVEITCDAQGLICENAASNNDIMLSLAYAVMYKAAEKLISKIVNSPNINRYTLLGIPQLQANANAYSVRYNEFVEWLSGPDGLNVEYNSCYACKGSTNGIRQNLLA